MAIMPKPEPPVVTVSPDRISFPRKAAYRVTKIPEIFESLLLHKCEQSGIGNVQEICGWNQCRY